MMMKVKLNDVWITNFVSTINWEGSATQCSRSLEIALINNPYDKNIKSPKIKLGDFLHLYQDKKRLFVGTVVNQERSGEVGTVVVKALDPMHHLLRSNGTYIFKNKSAEIITKIVCEDLKISVSNLSKTGVTIPKLIIDGESIYDIILKAYGKAKKHTGKKYIPTMDGLKVSVIEKGNWCGVTLDQSKNVTGSSYSESTESMINKVLILDDKGKQIGEEYENNWIKSYGIYQETYTKESGVNQKTAAKAILAGIEKSGSIDAIGDIRCLSGSAIKIKDSATKLTGIFWIETDSHTWEKGIHKMTLELAFKNIMESGGEETTSIGKESKKDNFSEASTAVGSLRERIVSVAAKELGTKETGDNRTKYGEWYGMNGVSWCAIFISWCAHQAGVSTAVIPKMSAVANTLDYARRNGKFKSKESGYRPKAGDIMILKSNGDSHVGIVSGSNESRFTTIEGNHAGEVAKVSHAYNIKGLTGFFVPGY